MKKLTLLFFLFSISIIGFAQSSKYKAQQYVQQGLQYHQRGALDRASKFYEEAVKIDSKYAEAYYLWGNALTGIAEDGKDEKIFKESFEKYKKATELDKELYDAYNDWACSVMKYGLIKDKLKSHASEVESLLKKAEKLSCQSAAYNYACLYSLTNNKKKALEWLNTLMSKEYTYKMGQLSRNVFDQDEDFDNIRESDEFIQFLSTNYPDQIPDRFQAI